MDIETGTKFVTVETDIEHNPKMLTPCNRIDVISLPSDVNAYISFEKSPAHDKKFPLKNNNSLLLDSDIGSDVYIYTEGTSVSPISLTLSTVKNTQNTKNVLITQNADKLGLDVDVSNALIQLDGMTNFLTNFDKVINPYLTPILLQGSNISTSETTLLNKILDCDKIDLSLIISRHITTGVATANSHAELDGVPILSVMSYYDTYGMSFESFKNVIIENVRGKTLIIKGISSSNYNGRKSFLLKEYTLKT